MPGQILQANDDSYVYDDGGGNVAVVPKSSLDPSSGVVQVWNAAQQAAQPARAAPAPDMTPMPTPAQGSAPPPMDDSLAGAPTPAPVLPPPAPVAPTPQPQSKPGAPVMPSPQTLQATALQTQMGALGDEQKAADQSAKVEAEGAAQKAAILDKRNSDIAMQQRAADAQLAADNQAKAKIKQDIAKAALAEDNFKVDQNKFYHDASTEKTIGMYVMAALAGLGQVIDHKDPTKNPVIEMMDAENQKDVNAQLDQRAQLGKKTARLKGDLADASTDAAGRQTEFYKRMATLSEGAARQIEAAGAHLAVPQAQANALQAAAAIRLHAADYVEKAGDKQWSQTFQQQTADRADKRAAQANAIAGGHLALAQRAQTLAEKKEVAEEMLKAAALKAPDAATQKMVMEQGVGGLKNDDGSQFIAGDKERATKLIDQKAGVDTVNEMINDIARDMKESGGANNYTSSPRFQRLEARKESLLFAMHAAYGIDGFKGSVLEHMEKALGPNGDLTSYVRDNTPELLQAKDNVNRAFTQKLRAHSNGRFTGEYKPPDTSAPPPAEDSADDTDVKQALRTPGKSVDVADLQGQIPGFSQMTGTDQATAIAELTGRNGGMMPAQRATIDALSNGAASDDPAKSKDALNKLLLIAREAEDPNVKAYAAGMLARQATNQLNQTPVSR